MRAISSVSNSPEVQRAPRPETSRSQAKPASTENHPAHDSSHATQRAAGKPHASDAPPPPQSTRAAAAPEAQSAAPGKDAAAAIQQAKSASGRLIAALKKAQTVSEKRSEAPAHTATQQPHSEHTSDSARVARFKSRIAALEQQPDQRGVAQRIERLQEKIRLLQNPRTDSTLHAPREDSKNLHEVTRSPREDATNQSEHPLPRFGAEDRIRGSSDDGIRSKPLPTTHDHLDDHLDEHLAERDDHAPRPAPTPQPTPGPVHDVGESLARRFGEIADRFEKLLAEMGQSKQLLERFSALVDKFAALTDTFQQGSSLTMILVDIRPGYLISDEIGSALRAAQITRQILKGLANDPFAVDMKTVRRIGNTLSRISDRIEKQFQSLASELGDRSFTAAHGHERLLRAFDDFATLTNLYVLA